MALKIPPSASGYYKPDLKKTVEHAGVPYKPGADITVDRATLDALIAAGGVASVVAAA